MGKIYAVRRGHNPGIYYEWETIGSIAGASDQVTGFPAVNSNPSHPTRKPNKENKYHAVAWGFRPGIYLGRALRDEQLEANEGAICFTTGRIEDAIEFFRGEEESTYYHVVFVPGLQSGAIFTDLDVARDVYQDRADNKIEVNVDTLTRADEMLQDFISNALSTQHVNQSAPAPASRPPPRKPFSAFDHDFGKRNENRGLDQTSIAYRERRTRALEDELMRRFVPEAIRTEDKVIKPSDMTEKHLCIAYRAICETVGIEPRDTAEDCAYDFRTQVLVDPTDIVNAKRAKTFPNFHLTWETFTAYTNNPDRHISREAAGPFLAGLLRIQDDAKALWEQERMNWQKGIELQDMGQMSTMKVTAKWINSHTNSRELKGYKPVDEPSTKRVKVEDE